MFLVEALIAQYTNESENVTGAKSVKVTEIHQEGCMTAIEETTEIETGTGTEIEMQSVIEIETKIVVIAGTEIEIEKKTVIVSASAIEIGTGATDIGNETATEAETGTGTEETGIEKETETETEAENANANEIETEIGSGTEIVIGIESEIEAHGVETIEGIAEGMIRKTIDETSGDVSEIAVEHVETEIQFRLTVMCPDDSVAGKAGLRRQCGKDEEAGAMVATAKTSRAHEGHGGCQHLATCRHVSGNSARPWSLGAGLETGLSKWHAP